MARFTTSIAGVIAIALIAPAAMAQDAVQYESRTYGDYSNVAPSVTDAGFASVHDEAQAIRQYQGQYTQAAPASATQQYEFPMAKTYASREEALANIQVEIFDTPIPAVSANTYNASSYTQAYTSPVVSNSATYSYPSEITTSSGATTHIVAAGETLYGIGRQYDLKASQVMNANNLTGSAIKPGQVLNIPSSVSTTTVQALPEQTQVVTTASTRVIRHVTPVPGNVHAVLPGDTLYSLAQRYCTTPTAIANASGIASGSVLALGQQLNLPVTHCQP